MIDPSETGSPGWWLNRLLQKLGSRREHYEFLDSYYRGENGIPITADRAVKESYRRLMAVARTNFAELVVEAPRERMMPVGFRTGASGDELGDSEAWRIWQANSLDADSLLVHRTQMAMSLGFVIVGSVDAEIGAPLITPEDPREVVVEHDPRRRRKILAGLKAFKDDVSGLDRAYLYLPGIVYQAARRSPPGGADAPVATDLGGWEWVNGGQKLPPQLANVVPVVPFVNRTDLAGSPQGEFEPHLPILDRINYTVLQRLEIATLQAFRQRAVSGVPRTDEHGDEIDYDDVFAASPGAMWLLPETGKLWESGQVDLGPVRQAIRDDIQDLAAVTRTPMFYLSPDAANGSAEGASLAREGLIFKTQDRMVTAGESWEQVMSLAFLFMGDLERGNRTDMEIIWAPPERYSLSQRGDAAAKAIAGGLTWRATMETVWQKTPQEIAVMQRDREREALFAPET